jgi:uracil-DNA glycosylase
MQQVSFTPPDHDCTLCPRLAAFHQANRKTHPDYHNGPVRSFGELSAQLLVVGLAPGLQGANQTGRPFTGDYAGFVLYESLVKSGFAKGNYIATLPRTLDGRIEGNTPSNHWLEQPGEFALSNCRITNAVRCVPPENKPETSEIKNCNSFLRQEIAAMPNLRVIVSLGLVSHNAVLKAFGQKPTAAAFIHGGVHPLNAQVKLLSSYHCSRYNINTKRLTQPMFDAIIEQAKSLAAY